jgi:hypothetical protein
MALLAATAAALAGCRAGIPVRTMTAPDAGLSSLHSFRVLPAPARRDGRAIDGADDPMIDNSIANRALRERIIRAFEDRGYTFDERHADFGVAFYASSKEKLDLSVWDYGYPFNPRWPRYPGPVPAPTAYIEGTVVVDVVKPDSRELLWRGEGKAELTNDAVDNVRELSKAAAAVVAQFPRASARVVASHP